MPKRRLTETKPSRTIYNRILKTSPWMYPPSRAFSLGDIITPDPTYYDPLPTEEHWYAKGLMFRPRDKAEELDRADNVPELVDWLMYGKPMKVIHARLSECLGFVTGEIEYNDYLLPPDPKAPQIPAEALADGHVLAVDIDGIIFGRVVGRTVEGYPCCRKGDPGFNAATRLFRLAMIEKRYLAEHKMRVAAESQIPGYLEDLENLNRQLAQLSQRTHKAEGRVEEYNRILKAKGIFLEEDLANGV
jgi:hypothetical protein